MYKKKNTYITTGLKLGGGMHHQLAITLLEKFQFSISKTNFSFNFGEKNGLYTMYKV